MSDRGIQARMNGDIRSAGQRGKATMVRDYASSRATGRRSRTQAIAEASYVMDSDRRLENSSSDAASAPNNRSQQAARAEQGVHWRRAFSVIVEVDVDIAISASAKE